jgi:hypothetical protein
VRQVNMAWQKENNRRGNPPSVFEPDPYLATLSSLDGWVVAQGSWDTSKRTAGAVGQGVLLLTHGRAKQPVVTTNWQVPPRIRQPGAAFGVLMSILLPRRNKSAHLAFGVQLQPAQLFIRDLTRKEWLAVEPFELPISGGERLLLTASMEQGEFRIELQLAGHDPVVAARHRGRSRGLIPEVYLGAWSFGAQMELRTIKIKQTSTTRRNR